MKNRPKLQPEFSAQPMAAKPNPMVRVAIATILDAGFNMKCVVDQGCGRLRHLNIMLENCKRLVLVETPFQLSRKMVMDGAICTIPDHVRSMHWARRNRIRIMSTELFGESHLGVDVVFSVCTFDVVPKAARLAMTVTAAQNLCDEGAYVVIAPRNDTTITNRFTKANAYQDGHVFYHHGIATFYANFRDNSSLIHMIERKGFELVVDLSNYRQVCLIFQKQG